MNTQEQVKALREAQEHLREATYLIKQVCRNNQYQSERIKGYILGHLEPLIDENHDWLGYSFTLEKVIKDIVDDSEYQDENKE